MCFFLHLLTKIFPSLSFLLNFFISVKLLIFFGEILIANIKKLYFY